ncbi:MAG: DUF3422 family protein, partial [Pseudomonadota bacterium]
KGFVLRHATDKDQYEEHAQLNLNPEKYWDRPNQLIVPEEFLDGALEDFSSSETADPSLTDRRRYSRFTNAQRLIAKYSKFYTRILGLRENPNKRRDFYGGNAVLCGFLDGLAIYGSRIVQPSDNALAPAEVQYFLMYNGPSRNQLARLVRRIHNCGENRIFALVDFKAVRLAAQELNHIAKQIEENTKVTSRDVAALSARVSAEAARTRSGLKQRVTRARYHRHSLRTRIATLRTTRIFGWQTYDEFVQRIFEPQIETYLNSAVVLEDIERRLSETEQKALVRGTNQLQVLAIPFLLLSLLEALDVATRSDWASDMAEQHPRLHGFMDPALQQVSWIALIVAFVMLMALLPPLLFRALRTTPGVRRLFGKRADRKR